MATLRSSVVPMAVAALAGWLPWVGISSAAEITPYAAADVGWAALEGSDGYRGAVRYGGAIGFGFGAPAIEIGVWHSNHDAKPSALTDSGSGPPTGGDPPPSEAPPPNQRFQSASLDLLSVSAAGRYNVDFENIRLYVSLGAGYHSVDIEVDHEHETNGEIGLDVGGGFDVTPIEHLSVGLALRYHILFTDRFDAPTAARGTALAEAADTVDILGRICLTF